MAITLNEVETSLKPIVSYNDFVGANVITLDNGCFVTTASFAQMFANATDMTATSLHAIDNGTMGYATYIDEWKTKGYIN